MSTFHRLFCKAFVSLYCVFAVINGLRHRRSLLPHFVVSPFFVRSFVSCGFGNLAASRFTGGSLAPCGGRSGFTALMTGAQNGHVAVVQLLLRRKATPDRGAFGKKRLLWEVVRDPRHTRARLH